MLEIRIEDFVPLQIKGPSEEWKIEYEKGQCFKATCESLDKQLVCNYTLTNVEEITENKRADKFNMSGWKQLYYKRKGVNCQNGTGVIRLSGGYVSRRFGYFRKQDFQDFLDKFKIDSVRNFETYGFDTTFLIESISEKQSRLIVPDNCRVEMIQNGVRKLWKEDVLFDTKDVIVANVKDAPIWIYEELLKTGDTTRASRRLYVHGSGVDVLEYENDVAAILSTDNYIQTAI